MAPLRILHTDFHRGWGGQASRIVMLSRELTRRGHDVVLAVPQGEVSRRAREAGLQVVDTFAFRSPSHLVSFVADMRRMAALLSSRPFDIVDVHGSQDTWVTALARAIWSRPGRLVLTRHNTKRVRTGIANRILYGRMIDHLILVDESVRSQYARFLSARLLTGDRISVVPSAYRADLFHEGVRGDRVRQELGLPADATVIGVAGRLVTDKGHTFLLQAAQRLLGRHPGLVLLFAGTGPHESALREEAVARGLSGCVRFLGFRADIAEVEAAFDIAVLPSIGCDASSASIKEAMALGVPVVASDIGGARFIIQDGMTGRVVAPGDAAALAEAIGALLASPDQAGAMARRARAEVAARFSIGRLADGTLQAYARALMALAGERAAAASVQAGRIA